MTDVNKEVEFNKMTKMHERVWENFKQAFDTKATVTKEEIIDVLKAYPYNLSFMSYFMVNFSTDSSEEACEIVCQIIENLKGLIELLLPLASVPMFTGDNSFIELKNYLFECEQIYELLQLNMLESMIGDITNIVKESIEDVEIDHTPLLYEEGHEILHINHFKQSKEWKQYRKKPVIIRAYQTKSELRIETLEGDMIANVGDYIIEGVKGELYPCKPDVFKETYEEVVNDD